MIEKTLREKVMEHLNYDPATGIFFWKKITSNRVKINQIAGYFASNGYINIKFNDRIYGAHRLAYLITYGYIPKEIDHINRIKSDNRIVNLQEVSHSENHRNTPKRSDNTSRVTGVNYDTAKKKWKARISINRKSKMLGRYEDFIEAAYTRWIAENIYNYSDIHGR